jgi:short-subunit dehydrogenase
VRLFEEAEKRGMTVDMLINNAGFGSMGDFATLDLERERNMIDLNIKSLLELTYRFLAPMRERRQGAIINVASTAGFQAVPFMATYAATKAFVLSFSEALWEENRPHGIKVMALCPGVTETNFFEAAHGHKPPARMAQSPEDVVETALRGIAQGKSHIISGWTNRAMVEAERLAPRSLVTRMAGRMMRSEQEKE